MTKTDDAIAAQTTLLNNFAPIITNLIKADSAHLAERDQALAQVASLLAADEKTASGILANSPQIQALLDAASAALLPAGAALLPAGAAPDVAVAS
ncbi:MAG: hypothetical protein V7K14_30615 [Nostoc sp.]|uniref:hypothetical protein n=1 Tax=Nostoc sp. TaxID=1180 RepID=UPI002FF8295E